MNAADLQIENSHVHKLLCAASGDAALLYLYIQSGNGPDTAARELHMTESRYACAAATLRQLGLWPEARRAVMPVGERPQYSEQDVLQAMGTDNSFHALYEEVQRLMGRTLNTEELKILLGFVRYLGLPEDVISVLVCYCKERARRKGSNRNPSLRTIEKEAYLWADRGIDTMQEAAAFIQAQDARYSQLGQLMRTLQIHNRQLTAAESRYAAQWLDWGFDQSALALAYDRTVVNTGRLVWKYMDSIVKSWHEKGLHTPEEIAAGDGRRVRPAAAQPTAGAHPQDDAARMQRMLEKLKKE